MIADVIDYLLHGPTVRDHVDLDNPHTVAKIAIGQARANADLWSMAGKARRMTAMERRERDARKVAYVGPLHGAVGRVLAMSGRRPI